MAPGVKAKVMYCKTEQVVSKKWTISDVVLQCGIYTSPNHWKPVTWNSLPDISRTTDGRRAFGCGSWQVSSGFQKSDMQVSTTIKQFVSNWFKSGAPNMVMIHGLSASTISDLGVPRFETKTACAASTKYPMDHCRSIPLTHGGSSGATSVVVNRCYWVPQPLLSQLYLGGIRLLTTIVGDIPIKSHELVG